MATTPKTLYRGQVTNPLVANGTTWVSRSIPSANWSSVAYGNGKFVAVAGSGAISISTDGITWSATSTPISATWNSITYGGGQFVVVGAASIGATSPDGVTWTQRSLGTSLNWSSVTYGAGLYVAVTSTASATNAAVSSPDGVTWTGRSLGIVGPAWSSVSYNSGRFVATATGGTYSSYSTNGTSWTYSATFPTTTSSFTSTAGVDLYNNPVFLAAQYNNNVYYTSSDGITWTSRTLPSTDLWVPVTYGGGIFAVLSQGTTVAYLSFDGEHWVTSYLPASNTWTSVTYGNGTYVAVSSNGTNRAASLAVPSVSPSTLYTVPSNTKTVVTDIAFLNPYNSGTATGTVIASLRLDGVEILSNVSVPSALNVSPKQVLDAGKTISCLLAQNLAYVHINGVELS